MFLPKFYRDAMLVLDEKMLWMKRWLLCMLLKMRINFFTPGENKLLVVDGYTLSNFFLTDRLSVWRHSRLPKATYRLMVLIFSMVACLHFVCIMLSVMMVKQWPLYQLDIKMHSCMKIFKRRCICFSPLIMTFKGRRIRSAN